MSEFSYKITVSASEQKEAERKMSSAVVLLKKLNVKELEKLADIVENDPVKTAIAKRALGM